ncbi:MAG TPA: sigma-70 family RNA polymerase sigma factor [Actinoplanes sp.]|jgi:RNA polymerase sigma-70 factor (ECF subfamily)
MTGSSPLAAAFDQQRPRLTALAHRILGSRPDAEDAVQEAWLRLTGQDADSIDNLAAWLSTVVGRICLDVLRSRRVVTEEPQLIVTQTPEDDTVLADSVGLALLVVLDTLRPAERLAFVLHDLFAVPFDEIASVLGKSTDATKMLASRARHKVRGTPPPSAERRRQRALVDAFMAAARGGDFEALLHVLDPDVTLRSHNVRGLTVHHGAADVAARIQRGAQSTLDARPVLVNGDPGLLAWSHTGRLLGVLAFTIQEDRITEILSVSDPSRLAGLS